MDIIERVKIEDIRRANPKMIFYAAHTCWWTHNENHLSHIPWSEAEIKGLAETMRLNSGNPDAPLDGFLNRARQAAPQLPCDPRGSVLFQTDKIEAFLQSAESNSRHYGRHGLRAFMAAHHDNCYVSFEDLRHTSGQEWSEYNDALDRIDELKQNPLRPDSPKLIAGLRTWLGDEGVAFFTEVHNQYGRLNVNWMEGSIPHPVHLREGIQIRNKLRSLTAFLWADTEYENKWEECVLRAIGKL